MHQTASFESHLLALSVAASGLQVYLSMPLPCAGGPKPNMGTSRRKTRRTIVLVRSEIDLGSTHVLGSARVDAPWRGLDALCLT